MRYLANKHNLMGSTPEEKARCDMLADGANELFDFWVAALWAEDYVRCNSAYSGKGEI